MSKEAPQAGVRFPARLWSSGSHCSFLGLSSTSEKDGAGLDDFSGASGFGDLGFCDGRGPNPQASSLAPSDAGSIQLS